MNVISQPIGAPDVASAPRRLPVYRDRIGAPSEIEFHRRQYVGFTTLSPVWIGRHVMPRASELGGEVIRLGGPGMGGWLRRALFRHLGMAPAIDLRGLAPVLHAQFARGGALALPLARSLGLRLVVTLHGGDVSKERNWHGTVQARRWPDVVAEAARFVCVSSTVGEIAQRHGVPCEKVTVLPIGVELGVAPKLEPDRPHYHLFVGRFVPKKGIHVLADAIRRLRAAGDNSRVVCVGDGPLRSVLEGLARDSGGVELTGWLPPKAVQERMARACSLLVPSVVAADGDMEGLPSVIPEAMAQACPVIGSAEGGIAEAVQHRRTGILVPAGDSGALADAIQTLASDSALRHGLGQAAFEFARAHLNARVQSAALERLLLEVGS